MPLAAFGLFRLVVCCGVGVDAAAVDGEGIDAYVGSACRLSFSVGRCGRGFPVGDAGVPAAVPAADGHLVGHAFGQGAGHSDAAQVGKADAPVVVIPDAVYS